MRLTMLEDRTTAHLDVDDLITDDMQRIRRAFEEEGHEIRIVGGAVRDLVLGHDPKDIDFATDATPEEMKVIFDKNSFSWIPTGEQHGTLTVLGPKDRVPFEITTLRIDTETDGRHADVQFTRDWEQDAERRDLTYNAMSMDFDGNVYDYRSGLSDIENSKTQFVGDAEKRIQEDYLRILRLFRFAGRFGHKLGVDTLEVIKDNVEGLHKISGERIWMEMSKILQGPVAGMDWLLQDMLTSGVLGAIGINKPAIGAAQQALKHGATAPTVLAVLVQTHDVFSKLADTWHISNDERDLGEFVLDYLYSKVPEDYAQDLLVDGADPFHIDELFKAKGKKNPVANWTAPEFPVSGKDLIATGMKPGPEMGRRLAALKNRWKQSRFSMSKEDLLG